MPIYEYHCKACEHHFEVMQKVSDQPPTNCPHCKRTKIEKLVSATSFQLKGTGWYATDFKDNNKKGAVKTEKQTEDGTSDTPAKQDDKKTKPADKTVDDKA